MTAQSYLQSILIRSFEILSTITGHFSEMNSSEITRLMLMCGGSFIVLMFVTRYLRIRKKISYLYSVRLLFLLLILVFLMPFVYLTFISFYLPSFAQHLPADLHTGSIILGSFFVLYSVFKLTNASIHILRRELPRNRWLEKKTIDYALNDTLTGLYNQLGFTLLTEHHMRLARRDQKSVLIFYVKLDTKRISESFGYQERDVMILETAKLLVNNFRRSDIISRVNEDTFIVFLINATKQQCTAIHDNFQSSLNSYYAEKKREHRLLIKFCAVPFNPIYNYRIDNIIAQAESYFTQKKKEAKEAILQFT